jgi:CBS-domain-containing membrane protein
VLAIAAMQGLSHWAGVPIMVVPFVTSVVLVFGSPEAPAARPRAVIIGHLISTTVGLIIAKLAGPGPATASIAVGVSMVAMQAVRAFHPPAGIDPLIVVLNDLPPSFLIMPVAIGAALLVLCASGWKRLVRNDATVQAGSDLPRESVAGRRDPARL